MDKSVIQRPLTGEEVDGIWSLSERKIQGESNLRLVLLLGLPHLYPPDSSQAEMADVGINRMYWKISPEMLRYLLDNRHLALSEVIALQLKSAPLLKQYLDKDKESTIDIGKFVLYLIHEKNTDEI